MPSTTCNGFIFLTLRDKWKKIPSRNASLLCAIIASQKSCQISSKEGMLNATIYLQLVLQWKRQVGGKITSYNSRLSQGGITYTVHKMDPKKFALGKTDMFHFMQKVWNQRGISLESWKFHINTILWKFQVPHYLCRDKIPTVELECNWNGTESHWIRLWKKCGIKVELTFRRRNSTLWNSFESSLSVVDLWHTVELL